MSIALLEQHHAELTAYLTSYDPRENPLVAVAADLLLLVDGKESKHNIKGQDIVLKLDLSGHELIELFLRLVGEDRLKRVMSKYRDALALVLQQFQQEENSHAATELYEQLTTDTAGKHIANLRKTWKQLDALTDIETELNKLPDSEIIERLTADKNTIGLLTAQRQVKTMELASLNTNFNRDDLMAQQREIQPIFTDDDIDFNAALAYIREKNFTNSDILKGCYMTVEDAENGGGFRGLSHHIGDAVDTLIGESTFFADNIREMQSFASLWQNPTPLTTKLAELTELIPDIASEKINKIKIIMDVYASIININSYFPTILQRTNQGGSGETVREQASITSHYRLRRTDSFTAEREMARSLQQQVNQFQYGGLLGSMPMLLEYFEKINVQIQKLSRIFGNKTTPHTLVIAKWCEDAAQIQAKLHEKIAAFSTACFKLVVKHDKTIKQDDYTAIAVALPSALQKEQEQAERLTSPARQQLIKHSLATEASHTSDAQGATPTKDPQTP